VVDFPTPPLQEDTAITDRTWDRPWGVAEVSPGAGLVGGGADVMVTWALRLVHGREFATVWHWVCNCSLMGQAGVVNSTSKDTSRVE